MDLIIESSSDASRSTLYLSKRDSVGKVEMEYAGSVVFTD